MIKVIEKPWGKEEVLHIVEKYMMKRLTMHKGCRCSLQYHERKTETVYIISGQLKITSGDSMQSLTNRIYKEHEFLTLVPGKIHRMEAITDSVYLEASTPELEDVVRIQDDYKR